MSESFKDENAERAVIGTILKNGAETFYEVSTIIKADCLTNSTHVALFNTIVKAVEHDVKTFDIQVLESYAKGLGYDRYFEDNIDYKYINSLYSQSVSHDNAVGLAKKVKKLHIAKDRFNKLREAQKEYEGVTGEESIEHILGIAEKAIYSQGDIDEINNTNPINIVERFDEYLEQLSRLKGNKIGLSTGFPQWDDAIGGGLRRGTVNVIGARMKQGKSMLGMNMGYHIAKNKTPVLMLDTEMSYEEHMARLLAKLSGLPIKSIESGRIFNNQDSRRDIEKCKSYLDKQVSYFYKNISGYSFEEQLAVMRNWIVKEVGFTDGETNNCLIILDYLKLMNSGDINYNSAEYQLLGFMMTSLHNFSVKYQIPILTFVQLNRDGISSEDTGVISGSDRIGWLCSNFTIFKHKSDNEIAMDGENKGNRKLMPLLTRHGAGLKNKDYISCQLDGQTAVVREIGLNEVVNASGGPVF